MAAADVSINLAAEFVGKHAFKQADTAVDRLNKNVKSLARTFGYTFGAAAVINFGKNSVKAFAADQKAALSLSKTIENLGLGYGGAALDVNNYISNLEKQTGILDDELRPAMDRLLRATSSITKSQELLGLALDISAGTGKDLTAVSQALQKAYLGQTQSLGRLGVGLSKAELTSSSFEEIQARLTTLFEGQAAQAADSYAGSIDKLSVAINNAKELIGKDLITALSALGGEGGFPSTLKLIESVSSGIGDLLIGVSRFIRDINIIAGKGSIIEKFRKLQAVSAADNLKDMKERAVYGGVYADQYKKEVAASAKVLKTNKAITKETAAQLKAKQLSDAIDKANRALQKADTLFDLQKIENATALDEVTKQLGKTTDEAQKLQLQNDAARLELKGDISDLEDAIAAKDIAAITRATDRVNKDQELVTAITEQNNALGEQKITIGSISSAVSAIKPASLFDLENINSAITLTNQVAQASLSAGLSAGTSLSQALSGAKYAAQAAQSALDVAVSVATPKITSTSAAATPTAIATTTATAIAETLPQIIAETVAETITAIQAPAVAGSTAATNALLADGITELNDTLNQFVMSSLGISSGGLAALAADGISIADYLTSIGQTSNAGVSTSGDVVVNINAGTVANPDQLVNMVQDAIITLNRRGDRLTTAGAL